MQFVNVRWTAWFSEHATAYWNKTIRFEGALSVHVLANRIKAASLNDRTSLTAFLWWTIKPNILSRNSLSRKKLVTSCSVLSDLSHHCLQGYCIPSLRQHQYDKAKFEAVQLVSICVSHLCPESSLQFLAFGFRPPNQTRSALATDAPSEATGGLVAWQRLLLGTAMRRAMLIFSNRNFLEVVALLQQPRPPPALFLNWTASMLRQSKARTHEYENKWNQDGTGDFISGMAQEATWTLLRGHSLPRAFHRHLRGSVTRHDKTTVEYCWNLKTRCDKTIQDS